MMINQPIPRYPSQIQVNRMSSPQYYPQYQQPNPMYPQNVQNSQLRPQSIIAQQQNQYPGSQTPPMGKQLTNEQKGEQARPAPYETVSTIKCEYIGQTTYRQMIKTITDKLQKQIGQQKQLVDQIKSDKTKQANVKQLQQHIQKIQNLCQCNQDIISRLQTLNNRLLDEHIFIFTGDIQPQNIQWQIWKHSSEITRFMTEMRPQLESIGDFDKREDRSTPRILQLYDSLRRNTLWTPRQMPALAQFINLVSNQPYLSKSVVNLTFIQHCMPLYLWNIKIYQQVPIYYNPNFLTKLIKKNKQNQIQKYLTVTGDGLIISSKNPLDTKIDQMVPFTNQFLFNSQIQDDDELYYTVSSCTHQNVKVSFKKDYVAGINFHIGLLRAFIDSGNININRFSSYSKPRQNCWAKLYNDGQGYFEDMYNQLLKARKQVCITDWWMTPYFLLKRDPKIGIDIHKVTYRLDGVLKFIADRGVKIFIILFRQPLGLLANDSYDCQIYLESLSRNIRMRRHPIAPQLWSHHEKCVIIDQRVGFMGGLDLCYGRWDNPKHYITNVNNYWDGGDYVNERLRAYTPGTTKHYDKPPIDRTTQARMPWHDIALQLKGDAVIDLARHYIQYWYFVDAERIKDPYNHIRNIRRRFDRAKGYYEPDWQEGDIDKTRQKQDGKSCGEALSLCGVRTKLFVTGTQMRIPQLLIQARQGKNKGTMQLQMCRSASPWSIGARDYEQSIHYAYQALIKQSQHFIYIENQFFMGTENKIVECIAERIRKAYVNNQDFKIVVVMPLLPGFEGDVSKRQNGPLRVQVYNQFQSINRGEKSIHKRLKDLPNLNLDDYIFFFGLRGHGVLDNKALTQIVYVHSKLMIVDDKRAIIGSANINDRSLCGNRDSQLAIVIEEDNGNIQDPNPRRKQIFDLRARLFDEHFGLTRQEVANNNSPQVWAKMINNAKNNTLIYRTLFGCYPDDTITVGEEVQERIDQSNPSLYSQLAPQIFGHAVEFPLRFMEDEDLQFQFGDKEGILGLDAFL